MAARDVRLNEEYHPRQIAFRDVWSTGGWRFKRYAIHYHGRKAPGEGDFAAAEAYAASLLPEIDRTPDTYGVGFLILHAAREADFLLLHWWGGENMVYHRVALRESGGPGPFVPAADDLAACVWELAVIGHERSAWIETVLASPHGPDLEAYLRRRYDALV